LLTQYLLSVGHSDLENMGAMVAGCKCKSE
jgi:hypothetical protein